MLRSLHPIEVVGIIAKKKKRCRGVRKHKNREGLVKGEDREEKEGKRENEKERSLLRRLWPLLKNPRSATGSV